MSDHEMKHSADTAQFERGLKSPLLTPIMENSPVKEADIADFLSTRLSPMMSETHVEYGHA